MLVKDLLGEVLRLNVSSPGTYSRSSRGFNFQGWDRGEVTEALASCVTFKGTPKLSYQSKLCIFKLYIHETPLNALVL